MQTPESAPAGRRGVPGAPRRTVTPPAGSIESPSPQPSPRERGEGGARAAGGGGAAADKAPQREGINPHLCRTRGLVVSKLHLIYRSTARASSQPRTSTR